MAEIYEETIRQIRCNGAILDVGEDAFVAIENFGHKGSIFVSHVKLEKIQKNGGIVLCDILKGSKFKVAPYQIIEIGDTLRRMNIAKFMTEKDWEEINQCNQILVFLS